MGVRIALAGNPNSGKTTLFNALTGQNQYVGNWPGVTVEKKHGKFKKHKDATLIDLPGIYSLSPYTQEEVIARNFLHHERPDAVLNIVDGTNLERNLYLTTQLLELGIPVVVAINMSDLLNKRGDKLDIDKLAKKLGCKVVAISALKGDGIERAAETVIKEAENGKASDVRRYSPAVEHALAHIEEYALHKLPQEQQRWCAVKLLERDKEFAKELELTETQLNHIEGDIRHLEEEFDDDAASIITNERYEWIVEILKDVHFNPQKGKLTTSDKIDKVVTNRWLALPIFALVMTLVYYISISTIGTMATDWVNDGLFGDGWHLFGIGSKAYEEACEDYVVPGAIKDAFVDAAEEKGLDPDKAVDLTATAYVRDDYGEIEEEIPVNYAKYEEVKDVEEPDPAAYGTWVEGIPIVVDKGLDAINAADWVKGLVLDGIIGGVGAVLGFVPQMVVLFLLLAVLELCGYMARIAFVMDRIFRKFGLSGKSFIPMLVGTGCSVPGIMASRTIENQRDRRMTVITTSFIPCSAKIPIIGLIAGAMFGRAWWVAPSAYFVGVAAVIVSGILLKKTTPFEGDPAPFVMELPAYHIPTLGGVLRSTWERARSFIRKAGTVILLSAIVLWFLQAFGFTEGGFGMVEDINHSILAKIGGFIAPVLAPLGFGFWQAAVATITGLIAKENVVGTFGILFGGFEEVAETGWQIWANMREAFTGISAYSFLLFNLLCAPCFAAIGAIKREMNNAKWTWFAIGYQTVFAYVISLIFYQVASAVTGNVNVLGLCTAIVLIALLIFMLTRPDKKRKLGNFEEQRI